MTWSFQVVETSCCFTIVLAELFLKIIFIRKKSYLEWLFCTSQNDALHIDKTLGKVEAPYHEILGAQHLSLYEKSKFFQSPIKVKVESPVAPWHLYSTAGLCSNFK